MQAAARLHRASERKAVGLTLLEGPHLVGEARTAGVPLVELFSTDDSYPDAVHVSQAAIERLSSTQTPQSPVAVIQIPKHSLDPERDVLVAWEIADPGNLGTMIRTAAAFGIDVAVLGGADPWSPKTLRGAAGAHFHTSVVEMEGLEEIDAVKVATVLGDGDPPSALPGGRLALLIGSEAHGLSPETLATADV
ncbi:MAG TPA: TrmH family RNA methyltransferase, partial [Acidimicrobiia bacterium]|nr:TrmH family RNA methyltransferase [Acidimicrobiia bacterium]